eukprot:1190403-Prorocentrum_minimum.AAC.5
MHEFTAAPTEGGGGGGSTLQVMDNNDNDGNTALNINDVDVSVSTGPLAFSPLGGTQSAPMVQVREYTAQ